MKVISEYIEFDYNRGIEYHIHLQPELSMDQISDNRYQPVGAYAIYSYCGITKNGTHRYRFEGIRYQIAPWSLPDVDRELIEATKTLIDEAERVQFRYWESDGKPKFPHLQKAINMASDAIRKIEIARAKK